MLENLQEITVSYQNSKNENFRMRTPKADIENNWHTTLLWDVYNGISANANETKSISPSKIQSFYKNIMKFAGEDSLLDDTELKQLANFLNVDSVELKGTITQVNGIALADEIHSNLKSGLFKTYDIEAFKTLIKEVSSSNIADVWARYNERQESLFGGHNGTLAEVIVKRFGNSKETSKLLQLLATKMFEASKDKNIEAYALIKDYNQAAKENDFEKRVKLLNELGERFYYAQRTKNAVWIHENLTDGVPKGTLLDDANKDKLKVMQNYAKNMNVEITEDLLGDGVIGNTQSKPTLKENWEAKMILNALNDLLQDPSFKEKIQACYRKENNQYAVYFPKHNARFATTDVEIVTTKRQLIDGVVGDGDMTVVVTAIMKAMEKTGQNISNEQDMRAYIKNMFD